MLTLTYGTLPSASDFEKHVRQAVDEQGAPVVASSAPVYWLTVTGRGQALAVSSAARKAGKGVQAAKSNERVDVKIASVKDLWRFVSELTNMYYEYENDYAGETADLILYDLGIEWV